VSESPDIVWLRLRVKGSSEGDCAQFERVELDAPLDDRDVIDVSTGEPVVTDVRGAAVSTRARTIAGWLLRD